MLWPAAFSPAPSLASPGRGPAAIEGVPARVARDGGQGMGKQPDRQGPAHADTADGRSTIQIVGGMPSLSTRVIGTLGQISGIGRGGALQDQDQTAFDPSADPSGPGLEASGQGGESEPDPDGLTDAERRQVTRLQDVDSRVRQHEAAHKSAGAGVTGAMSYSYVIGPDGRQYATGGEVSIDLPPSGSDPEVTIRALEQVIRAALAPADPSTTDHAVAAAARAALVQARAEARQVEAKDSEQTGQSAASAISSGSDAWSTGDGAIDGGGGAAPNEIRTAPGPGRGNPFSVATAAYGAAGALVPAGHAIQRGPGAAAGSNTRATFALTA